MRKDMLLYFGSVRRDPAIEAWLDAQSAELGAYARKWFSRMRDCGDDVRELMHDGCPVVCIQDAPFAYVNVFTSHTNVGFYYGAFLRDPGGLLLGNGKRMRHVKVKPGMEVDAAALGALIDAAYADVKARLSKENG
jgi:hypothetical protein